MAHRSTWFKHRPPGGRQTDGAIAAQPDVNDTLPPTVTFAPDDPRPARDGRAAVGVALATLAAVLLTWPFADAPFNDDWSYALTARTLADTGRLAYNGWASASLVAQAYWGAAWIKAFGFSFAVLRLSTIPLSTAAVGLCYLLVRRAGLRPPLAAFASLLLGWSPLYLPVAATFMTDAPGLFFTLAALYALVRAVDAGSSRSAIGWLIAGMAVGGVGGTGRQIVWVVPLTVGPYAAYARRGDVAFAVAAAVSWAVVLGGAAWTVRWFNRQMLTIPEPSPLSDVVLAVGKPVHYVGNVVGLGLTVVWVTLPALWPLGRAVAARRRRGVAAVVLLAAVAAVIALRHHQAVRTAAARHEAPHADPAHLWPYAMAPWMDNTLDPHGVMGSSEIANDRPVALPTPVRVGLGVVVFAAAAAALAVAGDVLFSDPAGVARRAVGLFARPDPRRFARQAGAIFALAYVGLMLPRSARDMTFDRYVLGRSSRQALLPQGTGPAAQSQPAHDHGRQEPGLPRAAADLKNSGELWRFSRLRQCKYSNNIAEQDHRRINAWSGPDLGSAACERQGGTLAGYEAMAMFRKGQGQNIDGRDMKAQAGFCCRPISGRCLRSTPTRGGKAHSRICNRTGSPMLASALAHRPTSAMAPAPRFMPR